MMRGLNSFPFDPRLRENAKTKTLCTLIHIEKDRGCYNFERVSIREVYRSPELGAYAMITACPTKPQAVYDCSIACK